MNILKIESRKIAIVVLSVVISFAFIAVAVNGATTISTNIVTEGTLSVTGLTSMIQASSTRMSVFDTAYFGGSATSTFDSAGNLTLVGTLTVTGTNTYNIDDAEKIDINSTLAAAATTVNVFEIDLDSASTGAVNGMYISIDATGNASTLYGLSVANLADSTDAIDALIHLNNADAVATDGIIIAADGGADMIVDAIDVSDTDITNAINVGDNVILGTTAVINFTEFDVSAAGLITVGNDEGLDVNTAGVLELGYTTATSILLGNSTVTTVDVTSPIFKHAFDANDYWTATLTDGGPVIFDDVTTGTAGFTFSDLMTVSAGITSGASISSDTADTDDFGTEALYWRKLYLASDISFEGSTDDAYQTTLTVTDTTSSDKTITFPDITGTVVTTGDTGSVTAAILTTTAKTNTMAVRIADISATETLYIMMPKSTVTKISTVLSGAIANVDALVTASEGSNAMANGVVTLAFSGSAAGNIDSASPTTNNVFDGSTQYLKLVGNGASTNVVPVIVIIEYTMTD